MKTQQSTLDTSLDHAGRDLDAQLASLFERCPNLCGFSVRNENDDLFVSDVGIAPRLSAEQYGEIFQDIAKTLAELLDERPEACELVSGRTFARTLQ
jgi:hypothetical protein